MKNFTHLSDSQLLHDTAQLAQREREITLEILHHLREVKSRRLYAARGYASLWEYAVKELRYSEAAAHRRTEAMNALETNPEIEEQVRDGALSLSVVAQAQKFFRHEAKAGEPQNRAEVFEALQNKSAREAERELLARSSNPATLFNAGRMVPKTEELIEVRFMIERQFEADVEKLRGLLAHRNPNLSLAELMKEAMSRALAQLDPAREPRRRAKKESSSENPKNDGAVHAPQAGQTSGAENLRAATKDREAETPRQPPSRVIPAATKREVWRRARGQCEFAGCKSCFGLEVDHVIPIARGGTHAISNLRLLCFQHNQYEAERILGREFMQSRRARPA